MGILEFQTQWQNLLEKSLFSQKVQFRDMDGNEYDLCGFFYSGTYGESQEGKYIRKKALKAQSFEVSALSLKKAGLTKEELVRGTLLVGINADYDTAEETRSFIVRATQGNDSGVVVMELG